MRDVVRQAVRDVRTGPSPPPPIRAQIHRATARTRHVVESAGDHWRRTGRCGS
ncbi:hypothetical protein ACFWBB_10485 [Streptomyces sp. NPDC060000]|uniref:hypothetical protein n=1 Tax=Streptomyces sp. NPDC060000 TaxID=3347031 RepID=UPI0036BD6747